MTSGSTAIVRAMHRRCCWPPDRPMPGVSRRSLTSSHRPTACSDRWTRSRRFSPRVPAELQARCHVVEDRHRRERVGLLEDHADQAAHGGHVDAGAVDVDVIELDLALRVRTGRHLVHAIEAAHERRLAAAGWADDGGHPVCLELDVDALQGLDAAVVGMQPFDSDRVAHTRARRLFRRRPYSSLERLAGRRAARLDAVPDAREDHAFGAPWPSRAAGDGCARGTFAPPHSRAAP